eukprot:PhM_4_TR9790/c1_g1_i3/m.24195
MRIGPVATSLARLLKMIGHGYVHADARPYMFGARLIAFQKGAKSIRPIASGEVLRRAAAKLLCSRVKTAARKFFLEVDQVDVAVSAGADSLILAADSVELGAHEVLVKVDFANAFNSISRAAIGREVAAHFPVLNGYFTTAYSAPTSLFFGADTIPSRAGVQQGDPLGPLFFSLALAARWKTLRGDTAAKGLRLKLGAWYLDDGVIAAHERVVAPLLTALGTWSSDGLNLNLAKCEVITRDGAPSLPNTMKRVHPDCWDILGTPLGTAAQVQARISAIVPRVLQRLAKVATLQDVRAAYLTTRYCICYGPLVHLMRAFGTSFAFRQFDREFRSLAERILQPMSADEWALAELPLRHGGLGLRPCHPFAAIARAAARRAAAPTATLLLKSEVLTHAESIVSQCPTLERFPTTRLSIMEDLRSLVATTHDDVSEQARWTHRLDQALADAWSAGPTVTARSKAIANSASAPLASAWLWGPGCDERRLPWMTSPEFLVAVLFRLGRDIFPADGSVKCRMCAAPLDAKGDHALTCLARGARTIVHHRIVEEFFALASAARLWPRKEDGNLFWPPHDNLRPDLVFRA